MSKFKNSVLKVVSLIPEGKVASYGQIALYVGLPRAARQVGWILNGLERSGHSLKIPWWRIVNNEGRISIKGSAHSANEQRELLVSEGIKVGEDLTFDIEEYRHLADQSFVNKLKLDPIYLQEMSRYISF